MTLSTALCRPDVFRRGLALAAEREERGAVQAAGLVEDGLPLPKPLRQRGGHSPVHAVVSLERRCAGTQRIDGDPPAEPARRRGEDVPPLLEARFQPGGRLAGEIDVDDVVDLRVIGMPAVLDGAEVVVRSDDAFGEQKPRGELAVGTRCAHDDREGAAVQPDFQRFLRRRHVVGAARRAAADARDADATIGSARVIHGCAV